MRARTQVDFITISFVISDAESLPELLVLDDVCCLR